MRVLIAEDDRRVAGLLKNRLKSDHISADVCYDGQEALELTSREYAILEYLIRNAGVVLSRDRILENVWSMDYEGASNMVDVYIRSLRKKVDDPFEKKLIHTVRGVGYVLRAQE